MDDDLTVAHLNPLNDSDQTDHSSQVTDEIANLQKDFHTRLVAANLRTEAVRAGMIDLDGLKLIDLSAVRLDNDDKILGGRTLMEDMRRNKPWLFGSTSSSSSAIAPTSQPVKQKTAMEMTDDEYSAARTAAIKYQF